MRMGGYYGRGGGGMDWQAGQESSYYGSPAINADALKTAEGLWPSAITVDRFAGTAGVGDPWNTNRDSVRYQDEKEKARLIMPYLMQMQMAREGNATEMAKARMQYGMQDRNLMDDLIKQRYAYRLQYGE